MPIVWSLAPPPPPPPLPRWELLEQPVLPVRAEPPKPLRQPLTPEEVEAVANSTPLQPADFRPLLRLAPAVPTANLLPPQQWRLGFTNISPFDSATGTGNQNYSLNLDAGLSETLQISGFLSQADDPLNAPLNGFDVQPGNLWESVGGAARLRLLQTNGWQLALNGSLERWRVGSGGSDSFPRKSDEASSNIFNGSGRRVETDNLVGSLSLPLSWAPSPQWQFSLAPGITVLPATQGKGQGGSGQFYGTSPYLSGGLLWQPLPQLGLTASVAQPIGFGYNSFNGDLNYSRVPILSAGLNWDLNPRIGLRGTLTNGFGATPATGLLALPSDNRLGYSAQFVYTPDAPDTPQPPLSSRHRSLARGGITVNTALVPPDDSTEFWVNADSDGSLNGFLGYSLSHVFQLGFANGVYHNVPPSTPQARIYAGDGDYNWRVGGKAVAFSPLRGAPFWGGFNVTLGRNSDSETRTRRGYVYAETMATWEATPKLAVNLNPKVVWSDTGNRYGVGISANVQLAPRWQLVPETNLVANDIGRSNGTLGVRWSATNNVAVETYVSTAASTLDLGQTLSADRVRWGGRLMVSF